MPLTSLESILYDICVATDFVIPSYYVYVSVHLLYSLNTVVAYIMYLVYSNRPSGPIERCVCLLVELYFTKEH